MSKDQNRKFFLVDRKSFDVIRNGKLLDGLRLCKNGKGFRVTISLVKKEVTWLVDSLSGFYWYKGGVMWGKKLMGCNRTLWLALYWNWNGRFLVLSEQKGKFFK